MMQEVCDEKGISKFHIHYSGFDRCFFPVRDECKGTDESHAGRGAV